MLRQLVAKAFISEVEPDDLASLQAGTLSGYEFFIRHCDGNLDGSDLSETGNAFTTLYYERYRRDFADLDPGTSYDDMMKRPYSAEDFTRIAALLDRRFAEWKRGELAPLKKPGWGQLLKRFFGGLD